MSFKKTILLFLLIFFHSSTFSQNSFYDIDTVREIRISFYDSNWNNILDSFYVAGSKNRILADILI